MSRFRITFLIGLSALALAGLSALPAASTAAGTAKSCKGLRVSYKRGGVTYSSKVTSLKATNTSCATAQKIAKLTAEKNVHSEAVPTKVDGFRVHVSGPCAGCTPVWNIKATKGSSKVTFKVLGGA